MKILRTGGGARIVCLKTWPEYFREVKLGNKNFEIRREDKEGFHFEKGDMLILEEFVPGQGSSSKGRYTGRKLLRRVEYVLRDSPSLPHGVVVLGLPIPTKCHHRS